MVALLVILSAVSAAQSFTVAPPSYFEASAYQLTGDSTIVWRPELPSVVIRVVVVIDSAWDASDSLKIGRSGIVASRPGDVWGSNISSRGEDATYCRVFLNAAGMFGVSRPLCLYHTLSGSTTGRIRIYIWHQPIDYTDQYTVFRTE